MKRQQRIVAARQQARIGTEVAVLIDGPSAEHELVLQGRLEGQAPDIDPVVYLTDCDPVGVRPRAAHPCAHRRGAGLRSDGDAGRASDLKAGTTYGSSGTAARARRERSSGLQPDRRPKILYTIGC